MPNKPGRFTFLIIPANASKVRKLNVSTNHIYGVCSAVAVLLAFGGFGLVRVLQHSSLEFRNSGLRAENQRLKTENDVYQNSYSKLKAQITFIEDQSKQLARQAKMEPVADMDEQVGVGGPETIAGLDRAAGQLEHQVRVIGDRLRSEQLRLSSIPSGLPVNGYVTDGFGIRRNPFGEGGEFHQGLDLAVDFGTAVDVTADGVVIWAGPYSGYGNLVAVYHTNGITTRYGHLSKVAVQVGQRVNRGDQIGYAGSTGRSTGPHVHYEVRVNDQPVDPARYTAAPHA